VSAFAPHPVDVLVVGLGPAGGAAAAAAARAGATVLAVDRRSRAGMPVQCAELIPLPLASRTAGDGIVVQRVGDMRTQLPSGAWESTAMPGLMIDRAAFDASLVRAALGAGSAVAFATSLRSVDAAERCATFLAEGVLTRVRYRVLVAADGPGSRVAAALGLPRLPVVQTRQYTVPLVRPFNTTDIWLGPAYPGGYAWLFPKGDVANLGVGLDPSLDRNLKASLDRLHGSLVAARRVGPAVLGRTGGAIPVGGLRERLVAGAVAFAGDAGGFTHPVSGAGIASAVRSGEAAGLAAARAAAGDVSALDDYGDEMHDEFDAALGRAVARRAALRCAWGRQAAGQDATHRRGWIAFPEYWQGQADQPDRDRRTSDQPDRDRRTSDQPDRDRRTSDQPDRVLI
jgi:geranylgeranyl reductase family protein